MNVKNDVASIRFFDHIQSFARPSARIVAVGVYQPDRIVTNEALIESLEASDTLKQRLPELLVSMTGIQSRRFVERGTAPSDLALNAVQNMVSSYDIDLSSIDTLIFASTDMDTFEPSTANILQHKLGLGAINSFDLSNACNSFLQAINVANSLIAGGASRKTLIASGEVGSFLINKKIRDKKDLKVKFGGLTLGDAGAAMLVESISPGTNGERNGAITEINNINIAEYWSCCRVPAATDNRMRNSYTITDCWFYLEFQKLGRIIRKYLPEYFRQYNRYRRSAFGESHYADSVAYGIPHQISSKIINEVAREIEYPPEQIINVIEHSGNTASTAIPLAFSRGIEEGKIEFGSGRDVVLFGAASGFSIGHVRITM